MAVSFAGGVASTASTNGVALGASWLFDLNDRTALEAEGSYLDRGPGADALSVSGSLLVNIISARERIVPYAAAGGGVYRSSFDMGNRALFGAVGAQFAPGDVVCPAAGTGMGPGFGPAFGAGTSCPATAAGYWGVGDMPQFYAQRLGPMTVPMNGVWGTRNFVDPAANFGGGLRLNITSTMMVRPDIRAFVVFADGDTHTVTVFNVQVGYRF
jgi:hypothetical protein